MGVATGEQKEATSTVEEAIAQQLGAIQLKDNEASKARRVIKELGQEIKDLQAQEQAMKESMESLEGAALAIAESVGVLQGQAASLKAQLGTPLTNTLGEGEQLERLGEQRERTEAEIEATNSALKELAKKS